MTEPVLSQGTQHRKTDTFQFSPAVRRQKHGRILLDGPPGSGATYTALALATGIGSRIAVIDTQRGRTSQYADSFTFDTCPPLRNCAPGTLVTALAHCADQGYDTVVVSTLSHFWNGPDGILERVDRAARRGTSGTRSGWTEVRPAERRMLDALLAYPGHVIATVRDKLDYLTETDERGSLIRRIMPLAPIGRDGMEYEWDVVATMDHTHTLVAVKAPAELSGAVEYRPGRDFATRLKTWLDEGEPLPAPPTDLAQEALRPDATFDELGDLMHRVRSRQAEGHPLLLPDGTGTTLGSYITQRGNQLRPRN